MWMGYVITIALEIEKRQHKYLQKSLNKDCAERSKSTSYFHEKGNIQQTE